MALKPGQQKCIETLNKPIVVAAGAGSGKTFTLTKRIVGALQSGYVDDIGQICAITFTNKAAAELKSRVKSELRACGLVEQALKADDAWISTIHGMCARILRSHALELGIDPLFAIAETSQLHLLMEQALQQVLVQARIDAGDSDGSNAAAASAGTRSEGAGSLAALFEEYPVDGGFGGASTVRGMLQALVEAAAVHPRGADAFVLPRFESSPAALCDKALRAFGSVCEAAQEEKASASRDAWLAQAQEALAAAQAELERGDVQDAKRALRLLAGCKVARSFGGKPFKQLASEAAQEIAHSVMSLRLMAAHPHLETLAFLARQVLARFDAQKRAAGLLDNNDLLVLAAEALQGHPAIAAEYADRFRLVMVDEFQDTDQMQVDMIRRIAGPQVQRLCVVGDAQQSIYRFRGADVSVYRRHLASVRAHDAEGVIQLPDNFRSHADVLALVDRVFARDDMFGGEFMSLAASRDEAQVSKPFAAGLPRVRLQQTTKAYRNGVPSEQVVEEQARRIARTFAELRDEGREAGEMAVLLGRMSHAGVYAQALREQGLACVVAGGSVFAGTAEAQLMCELARAVVNPRDTQALWQVLAGPLFGVPDAELLWLATQADAHDGLPRRRRLDAGLRALQESLSTPREQEAGAPALTPQLECAVRVLGDAWRALGGKPLSQCLMQVLLDSGWLARLEEAGPEGLAAAGNAYKAIRMVEEVEDGGAAGPVSVLRGFEELLSLAKEPPGALSATGGDFVRIMTVHASKGLEFPVVAIAEFKEVKPDASKLLLLPEGESIVLSLDLSASKERLGGIVDSLRPEQEVYPALLEGLVGEDALKQAAACASDALLQRAAISECGRLGDEEEAKRLLYVALTRARECVVISLAGTRTKDNPNGLPKNCLRALPLALAGEEGFCPGSGSYDFGGSMPAVVEHVALELEDGSDASGELAQASEDAAAADAHGDADAGAADASVDAAAGFWVPAPFERPQVMRVPCALSAREGVFSYSSIAEASHAGDVLPALAARFSISCDAALQEDAAPEAPVVEELPALAQGDCADADKATDFGTAFHRLAQYAVEQRQAAEEPGDALDASAGAALQLPSRSRIEALARTCQLSESHRERLDEALARWFGSDEAELMAAWPQLRAEVPFFLALPLEQAEGLDGADFASDAFAFLEGEIDLLALDERTKRARVVDYKTGGHPAEEEEALRQKHVLQASCYAYALLEQGIQEVEASFVRVERPRADDAAQPQCVRYRFTAADAPLLRQAILAAYRQAQGLS